MTPGINLARKQKIAHTVHEYSHDPDSESYGQEAADKLGVPASLVFKTLVVSLDNKALAVAVLPVSGMLSMKQIARAAGFIELHAANPAYAGSALEGMSEN